jgi:hypothetical protein
MEYFKQSQRFAGAADIAVFARNIAIFEVRSAHTLYFVRHFFDDFRERMIRLVLSEDESSFCL